MKHELKRCLVVEKNPNLNDWDEDTDEVCDQMYMDDLGYGINGKYK